MSCNDQLNEKNIFPLTADDVSAEGNSPLHLAAARGDLPVVQNLVGKGEISLEVRNLRDSTPLHLAAEAGHLTIVR